MGKPQEKRVQFSPSSSLVQLEILNKALETIFQIQVVKGLSALMRNQKCC